MSVFKKVCLVAPDGWTARLAIGLQKRNPQCEITVVGADSSYPVLQGAANVGLVTDNLFEGLRRSDLVLISRHNSTQSWNLREVVISSEAGTTICEFGRPVTEALRLIREFDRSDAHYISIGISGVLDTPQSAETCCDDLFSNRAIGLTPSSIEDLQSFSILQDVLRDLGASITAISPQQHDRRLAEVAYLPRLAMMPVIRYWSESSDINESRSSLIQTSALNFFGDLTRQQLAEWVEEVFHSKAHVLRALDGYTQHLNSLRQEIESDKLADSASQLLRQLTELRTEPISIPVQFSQPKSVKPTVETVLNLLGNVWQTLEQVEQSVSSDGSETELSEIRNLLDRTRTHVRQLQQVPHAKTATVNPPPTNVPAYADNEQHYQPEVATVESYSSEISSPYMQEEVVEDYQPSYVSETTYDDVITETPPVIETVPSAPLQESFSSNGRDLWLMCGSDVQAFATAARVLADARIGVENVERQQQESGMLVRITLREVEQANRARDLLAQAGIAVQ